MTALTPTDAASCRAMAVECGRRANKNWARGFTIAALADIEHARQLVLLALKFEREQNSLPSPSQATDMAGAEFPPLAAPATHSNPPFAAPPVPHTTTPSSESPEGEAQSLSGTNSSEVTA